MKVLVRAILTRNNGRHETYRTSQSKPSVAVCFLVLSSLTTRAWRFSDSEGVASWRSRTFLISLSANVLRAILQRRDKTPWCCPAYHFLQDWRRRILAHLHSGESCQGPIEQINQGRPTKKSGQWLCSLKKSSGINGIAFTGIDRHMDEWFVEGIEPCASCWIGWGRGWCWCHCWIVCFTWGYTEFT